MGAPATEPHAAARVNVLAVLLEESATDVVIANAHTRFRPVRIWRSEIADYQRLHMASRGSDVCSMTMSLDVAARLGVIGQELL